MKLTTRWRLKILLKRYLGMKWFLTLLIIFYDSYMPRKCPEPAGGVVCIVEQPLSGAKKVTACIGSYCITSSKEHLFSSYIIIVSVPQ